MDRLFLETKVLADDTGAISGIVWPFGSPDRMGDLIEPEAFKGLKLPLPMLFGHHLNEPIGTWTSADVRADGVHIAGKMLVDAVARAREVFALVKAGAIGGLSIGYIAKKSMSRPGGGRTIKALDIFEASLVTVPMHPGAKVTSAKSAATALALVAAINRASTALTRS